MKQDARLAFKLNSYFELASPLIRAAQVGEARSHLVSAARLAAILREARIHLEQLQSATSANMWDTAGLGTDEVRICSVLAKLWDWHHYGNEGQMFLARCLSILGPDHAPSINELRQGYRVQTEHCLNDILADRVDITVETARSIVGIEVKVHAGEGERQLARYVQSIANRAALMRRCNPQVLFLSPRRPTDKHTSASWLTWRQVADAAAMADAANYAGLQIREFGKFCGKLGA